mgnify:CR=1 FL=1
MANSQANKFEFNCKGNMKLNLNRNEIKTDIQFNRKNSPVFGGALSPLWKKEIPLNALQPRAVFDTDGNQWSINSNSKLAKNGVELSNSPDLTYSWREDTLGETLFAKDEILAYSAVENIPDIDAIYGDTDFKGGFVKVYKKASDGAVYIFWKNASEENEVKTDVTFDEYEYKFKIVWNTRKITYNGVTYDTIRPVIFQYAMFENNSQLMYTVWFPAIANGDGLESCLFDKTTSGQVTFTTPISEIGNGGWFVELGEIINQWTDKGTVKNRGLIAGSIYARSGHYSKEDEIISTNFVFDVDVQAGGIVHLTTWNSFLDDIKGGFKHRIYGVNKSRFSGGNTTNACIVNLGVADYQDSGLFIASASNSNTNVLTLTTLQNYYGYEVASADVVAYSFDLLPGFFRCYCAKKIGDKYTLSETGLLFSCKYRPLSLNTADITSDTDITNGFGSIRHKEDYLSSRFYSECLINNGFFSGFHSPFGNLITEWNTIDNDVEPVFVQQNFSTDDNYIFMYDNDMQIFYRNTQGEKKVLTRTKKQTKIIDLYADRYLLTDADAEFNAYDIYTDTWFKWTSDWNNRLEFQRNTRATLPTTETKTYYTLTATPELTSVVMASAMNANFEVTAKPFISAQFPEVIGFVMDSPNATLYYACLLGVEYQTVDIYFSVSTENANAVYRKSIFATYGEQKNYTDIDLDGLLYPTGNIIYNLCLISEIINSYNNLDYVVFGNNFLNTEQSKNAYALIYFNNAIIFGYMLTSYIENIKAIFVIQTSTYFVIGNKIVYVSFNGQTISGMVFLTDIKGLSFLGALPDMALFYSPVNKTIYSFTGDSILRPFLEASNILAIHKTFYLPEIQAILISVLNADGTQKSLVFLQDNIFEIDYGNIKRVQYDSKTNSIILEQETSAKKFAFSYPIFTDFTSEKVKFQTEFVGIGNESVGILSAWLIRLYQSPIICPTDGEIVIRQNTMTDKGTQTEEKKIKISKSDWDKVTGGYYFRFQPKYQRGVGFQLEVESDFAIQSIVGELSQDTTQIAKHNI